MKTILCARCKRKLYGKEARYVGMGSTCAKKNPGLAATMRAEAQGQMRLFAFPKKQTEQQKAGVNERLNKWPLGDLKMSKTWGTSK